MWVVVRGVLPVLGGSSWGDCGGCGSCSGLLFEHGPVEDVIVLVVEGAEQYTE